MIKFNRLCESPDAIHKYDGSWGYHKLISKYNDSDAFAFGIIDNKMYIGNPAKSHGVLGDKDEKLNIMLKKNIDFDREVFKYPGRFWLNKKLISFWIYPKTNSELRKIIRSIENAFYDKFNKIIKIWDDLNFLIEINNQEKIPIGVNGENWGNNYNGDWETYSDKTRELIPIKMFNKSADYSEEEFKKDHILSPSKKKKRYVPDGWGNKFHKDNGTEKRLRWKFAHKNETVKNKLIDNNLFD